VQLHPQNSTNFLDWVDFSQLIALALASAGVFVLAMSLWRQINPLNLFPPVRVNIQIGAQNNGNNDNFIWWRKLQGYQQQKSNSGKATDATVITPLNPGKFGSVRSTPIVEAPRYFTKEETDAMKALAKDKTEGARQAKRAYKALSRIEEADAKVHKSHRAYESSVATNELTKKRADVKHAKNLHALRPGYARLGVGLEKAETDAAARIEAIRTKLLGGTDK
jgi:hypothetical protein